MNNIRNFTREVYTRLFGRCKFDWILPDDKSNCSGRKDCGGDSSCDTCPLFVDGDHWTEKTY